MANENRNYNVCTNWGLYCFDMKETQTGVRLNCAMNGKKKNDGTYEKGLSMGVFCSFETCDIPEDDYSKCFIDVDGGFTISEYVGNDGIARPSITIFADKVRKHEWNNQ